VSYAKNISEYTGQQILAIAGFTPSASPCHRALEREAAEAVDISERDYAARCAYARRGVQ
jgi:hypothetical protein